MLPAISPTAVAAHLARVQNGLQLLYRSARMVRANPGMFPAPAVAELRGMLERGAFEVWQCEHLLSGCAAANDQAEPAQALTPHVQCRQPQRAHLGKIRDWSAGGAPTTPRPPHA